MYSASCNIDKRVVDFSQRPGPRYISQGDYSGELFYKKCLRHWFQEALDKGCHLTVILDGTDGYLSSFIDEAFGRLVYDYGRECVEQNLTVTSRIETIWPGKLRSKTYPAWQERKEQNLAPLNTDA